MGKPFDIAGTEDECAARQLVELLNCGRSTLVKKLSNNDRDWAQFTNKHQAGVYMPPTQRDSGFFPPLKNNQGRKTGAPEIREIFFPTYWPQYGEEKTTRLVHYTSKGPETHMTALPKEAFAHLSPASFLVMSPKSNRPEGGYVCLTIDSASDEADILVEALDLEADFLCDIRNPVDHKTRNHDRVLTFADQLLDAWLKGNIADFAKKQGAMPAPIELAKMARGEFCKTHGRTNLNPFELTAPGDNVREISRSIEWSMFRSYQARQKAIAIVRLVLSDRPNKMESKSIIASLVENLPEIDRMMLSASQQRKSRAGLSFEHHIESMLADGKIPFEKQVIIEARKRPDFVLPSLTWLTECNDGKAKGLILSAKTTLRERWKQVQREMGERDLFLATVDENIAANAIEDMASLGIMLVVPESFKKAGPSKPKITEYSRHENVIDFKSFFENELRESRMPNWS